MEDSGVKFRNGVVPSKLVKNSDGTIAVTFSDGNSENYDTVLVAIGRSADTSKLGLENVGVKFSDRNGKIPCVHEQTNTPNVYAIGDVMEVSREPFGRRVRSCLLRQFLRCCARLSAALGLM